MVSKILRTNSEHPDFISLVSFLDKDLALRDGEDHAFYAQFNAIAMLSHAIVVYRNDRPAACGAMKEFDKNTMEIKRMYTLPAHRSHGLATMVLSELEDWASELGYGASVLETGKRQPEAIALYEKYGYVKTPNYGQYEGIDNSVCFKKRLND